MLVVADSSPFVVLVKIDQVDVLPKLYGSIPPASVAKYRCPAENLILRREAIFAHRCPRCKGIIHGLIVHRPGDPVPSPWREPGGHVQEIHFRAFSQPAPGYITAPEYVAAMIDVGDPCGQYFYDAYHFAQF